MSKVQSAAASASQCLLSDLMRSVGNVRSPEGFGGPRWTEEDLEYLRANYHLMPAAEIAAVLGRTPNAIHVRANIEGLRSWHHAGHYSLVRDYFRNIGTPMKAYLLGLLLADGSVSPANQLKLEIHEKDRCLAELARDEIAPQARIGSYSTDTSPMVRFMIQSADLAADLADHGVVHRKTLVTSWPDEVHPRYENSFVCGYYDGDGSIDRRSPYRWSVVSGNPEFLGDIQACIAERLGYGSAARTRTDATTMRGRLWPLASRSEP